MRRLHLDPTTPVRWREINYPSQPASSTAKSGAHLQHARAVSAATQPAVRFADVFHRDGVRGNAVVLARAGLVYSHAMWLSELG